MRKYANKKAVITGGTTGIGFATAKALIEEGAEVLVTGRSDATIEAARLALGPRAHVVRSDTACPDDVGTLGAIAHEKLGAIDFVFVNAGISRFMPLAKVTAAFFDEIFNVNTKGAYFVVQRLAPLVRDGGSFVFNTSVADELGLANHSIYSASKAALRSFARALAAELAPSRIRVNAVSPGPIDTPINSKFGLSKSEQAEFEKQAEAIVPLKRMGKPEEVARAALFLAFDATFTTGAELPVDGGVTQI